MKALAASVVTVCAFALSTPASAQFSKPEDAIRYRQSVMTVMAHHFYRSLGAMANGRIAFDAKQAADSAAIVDTLSRLPWTAFGEGTGKGANTSALPEIWKDPAKFKEASEKMLAEIVKLNAAAKVGTLEALKPAYGNAARTCKACHDKFQAE